MSISRRKVAIIGAGHVGSHASLELIAQGLAEEIVLLDLNEIKAQGQAQDLSDAVVYHQKRTIVKAGTYADIKDADILVIAFRSLEEVKPDESRRMASLTVQVKQAKTVTQEIKKSGFDGIIISISNPADVIAHYFQNALQWKREKIFSTGTTLDTARLRAEISRHFGYDAKSVSAYVAGEHGETQFVPWSWVQIGGKPLADIISDNPRFKQINLASIAKTVKDRAYTICQGKFATEFGIAASLAEVVRAIFGDEDRILPLSVLLQGEYGVQNVFVNVPVRVNHTGIAEIIERKFTDEEQKQFDASVSFLDDNYKKALTL